jgi:hypothetical protein
MGGDILATSIVDKINAISNISLNAGLVLVGTYSKNQLSADLTNGGWSSLIEKYNLDIVDIV